MLFREQNLSAARIEVLQASTETWARFPRRPDHGRSGRPGSTGSDRGLGDRRGLGADRGPFFGGRPGRRAGRPGLCPRPLWRGARVFRRRSGCGRGRAERGAGLGCRQYRGRVGIAVVDSGVQRQPELIPGHAGRAHGTAQGWSALPGRLGQYGNSGSQRPRNLGRVGGQQCLVREYGGSTVEDAEDEETSGLRSYYGVAPDSTIVPVQVLDKRARAAIRR